MSFDDAVHLLVYVPLAALGLLLGVNLTIIVARLLKADRVAKWTVDNFGPLARPFRLGNPPQDHVARQH